jgi:hypothetical protein
MAKFVRVVAPGGSVLQMIPQPSAVTAPPAVEEFHGDNTRVFWRFGWDLRDLIEAAGIEATRLVIQPLIDRIRSGHFDDRHFDSDMDKVDLLTHADPDSLTAIADGRQGRRFGFESDPHFIIWYCQKRAA